MVDNIFLQLFLVFIGARVFSEVFARMGIPSVLGEIGAGVLLGSSVLGLIEPNKTLEILAHLGIMLLLFEVGMETDVKRLVQSGRDSMIVAVLGAAAPFGLGFLVSHYIFDFNVISSLFVGGTLTATSIGITLRVLKDIGKQDSYVAQVVTGAAIIDDVIGVLLLVFVYDLAVTGEVSLFNTGKVFAITMVFFLLAPIAAYLASLFIHYLGPNHRVQGFEVTLIISLILLFGYISHHMGVPEILGSFAAGIALSRRFMLPFGLALRQLERHYFLNHIENNMKPIIALFTPVFFVMVGLNLNLQVVDLGSLHFWMVSSVLLFLAVLGKMAGVLWVRGCDAKDRLAIGAAMVVRGEVGLIFANLGLNQGVFGDEIYAILIFVVALTTVFPPLWIQSMYRNVKTA